MGLGAGTGAAAFSGRSGQWLARWTTDRLDAGTSVFDFDLPIGVEAFRLTGDEASQRVVQAIELQPVEPHPIVAGLSEPRAWSSGRYGDLQIFNIAGAAYFEPGGIWTSGDATAELAIAAPPGRVKAAVWVGAGALATTMTLSFGGETSEVALEAGERRLVDLSFRPGRPVVLRVRAARGFRPSDVEPGSADRRLLGARIVVADDGAR